MIEIKRTLIVFIKNKLENTRANFEQKNLVYLDNEKLFEANTRTKTDRSYYLPSIFVDRLNSKCFYLSKLAFFVIQRQRLKNSYSKF